MLTLPSNWRELSAGFVVRDLLRQAQIAGTYPATASLLTYACLRQLIGSRGWDKRPTGPRVRRHRYGFRIGNSLVHVLPDVDDEAIDTLRELSRGPVRVTVLAPPWSVRVAHHCAAAIEGNDALQVVGIDEYAGLRNLFTSMDLTMSPDAVLARLFDIYNTEARLAKPEKGQIQLPHEH